MPSADISEAALALWLADRAAAAPITFIARSETRLDRLARACAGFCAGRVDLIVLPPWDVLPYDRVAPSPAAIGRRIAALLRLAAPADRPRLLLTSAETVLQRVPPAAALRGGALRLAVGEAWDAERLRGELGARGYHAGETVSEPGEAAFRGQVVDLFPTAAAAPVRVVVADGRIAELRCFDPLTQRTDGEIDHVALHPAVEFPLDPEEAQEAIDGDATPLALPSGQLVPLFDHLPGFEFVIDEGSEARWAELREQAQDAYEASRRYRRAADRDGVLPRPERLFLPPAQAAERCFPRLVPDVTASDEPPARRLGDLIRRASAAATPVVIAAPGDPEAVARSLSRRGLEARAATDWRDAIQGGVACHALDIDSGLRTERFLVLPAAQFMRTDTAARRGPVLAGEAELRTGDLVIHLEHGAARLGGLKTVETGGQTEERVALAFADDAELLVPVTDLDRIWRYGSEGSRDRLGGDGWQRKRAEIEAEIGETAATLAQLAAERAARQGAALHPDQAAYDRLARRFAYTLSADQRAAAEAVLADLARGSPPMERLVCGDVGFGKTEVALRAAAAAVFAGHQVAVAAPTTVLARQHLETFRRRFAGSGIRVEPMMQAASDPRRREIRAGLADGSIGIVVGTQALASPAVRFNRLGLVVIDEEQRFGEADKQALIGKPGQHGSSAAHTLIMTATPIPRTLQTALIGLREVSVIATAPVRRQPTRSFVLPYDPVTVRDALMREQRRGGQSFVVCPRIADLAAMAGRLAELVPELSVVQAHGRMRAEALEATIVDFADGEGDVLLATNIIEAGLDIPRANTILITQADRFGLAQLHQMRGRVGRGARRGFAYLLSEPGRRLAPRTLARLRTLETLGGLGAGVAISAADLDQRGAGELFGAAQAGHVSRLGTELYQHLLLRAVEARQGKAAPPAPPELQVELGGLIPDDVVGEPELRLALYRRLARLRGTADADDLAEELEDRFGAIPPVLEDLLALARLRCVGAASGIARLQAGPRGAALELHDPRRLHKTAAALGGTVRDDRVLLPVQAANPAARVRQLIDLLAAAAAVEP